MSSKPLEIVERIARSRDRQRAYVFFLFFSRFEYALKRARFARTTGTGTVEADWDTFARSSPDLLARPDEQVFSAIQYLNEDPPKKQVMSAGALAWEADKHQGPLDIKRILVLLRRIRNNLFHGGKFPGGPESDASRDARLLDAGITIMQACLDSHRDLREFFLEDLSRDLGD